MRHKMFSQLPQPDYYTHIRFTNNLTIQNTNASLCQPNCYGIWFRTVCKLHHKASYEMNLTQHTQLHTRTLHMISYTSTYSYNSTYKDIFAQSCYLKQKILYETKLSQSTQIHTHWHFTRNFKLLHIEKFMHQTEYIQE